MKPAPNRHHVHLSVLTPFRAGRANVEYIIKPDEDTFNIYNSESKLKSINYADTVNSVIQPYEIVTVSPLVDVWLDSRLETVLADLGQNSQNLAQIYRDTLFQCSLGRPSKWLLF